MSATGFVRIVAERPCLTCKDRPGWRPGPLKQYGELVLCELCQGTGFVRSTMTIEELAERLRAVPATQHPEGPTKEGERGDLSKEGCLSTNSPDVNQSGVCQPIAFGPGIGDPSATPRVWVPPALAERLRAELAQAPEHVHRDLKPENASACRAHEGESSSALEQETTASVERPISDADRMYVEYLKHRDPGKPLLSKEGFWRALNKAAEKGGGRG